MKKVTAILTALVLALGLGSTFAMAEEDYKPSTPEMKVYESIWVSNDGNARVWIGRQDDGFQIEAMQRNGDGTVTAWEYLSNFDEESNSLKDARGIKGDYKIADGKAELIEGTNEDDAGASFTVDENGVLIWKEAKEGGFDIGLLRIGNFAGRYVHDRAALDFVWDVHDNEYNILLTWGESADQTWEYILKGTYIPETETVKFQGLKQLLTYKEDGEIDTTAEIEQGEVKGSCFFNENGGLVWQASDLDEGEIVFENELLPIWELEM